MFRPVIPAKAGIHKTNQDNHAKPTPNPNNVILVKTGTTHPLARIYTVIPAKAGIHKTNQDSHAKSVPN